MGRVYDIDPAPGEYNGIGICVYWATGGQMLGAYRLEFDADTDDGMATVHSYLNADGAFQFNQGDNSPIRVTFRTYVRVRPRGTGGKIEPIKLFHRDANGRVAAGDPDEADAPLVVGG